MTEQEYCDLSDLQLLRAAKVILKNVNSLNNPKADTKMRAINIYISTLTVELERKVAIDVEKD